MAESIFKKFKEYAGALLDEQITKSKNSSKANTDLIVRKGIDAFEINETAEVGFKEKMSSIGPELLKQLAAKDAIVAAIIQTRIYQLKNFCQPQNDKYSPGFKFSLRDEEATPKDDDKEEIKALQTWLLNTGSKDDRPTNTKMEFGDFISVLTKDLLRFDQIAVELIQAKDGSLAYFLPLDGGSVRYATRNLTKDLIMENPVGFSDVEDYAIVAEKDLSSDENHQDERYKYCQLWYGKIVRAFYEDELIFRMMNPSTDLELNGYSMGPLELAASIVSYHLFAEAHNKLYFIQGGGRGILHIKSDVDRRQLDGFRKQFREQQMGVSNAWRTMVLGGEGDVQWITTDQSNKDMEWSAWIEYLLKVLTALFSINPQEINFDIVSGSGSKLGDSGSKTGKNYSESKFKGLKPILQFYESVINEDLIYKFDENLYKKYKFEFVGMEIEDREEEISRNEKEVKLFKTVNEIRAEHDLDEIEGCDIILDPQFMAWFSSFSEQGQAKQEKDQQMQMDQASAQMPQDGSDNGVDPETNNAIDSFASKSLTKSKFKQPKLLKVEWYKK